MDFAGYVSKLDDGAVTSHEMTAEQTEENLDTMIRALFRSGSALASFVFLFSLMQIIPFYLLAVLLLTILVWIACKPDTRAIAPAFRCLQGGRCHPHDECRCNGAERRHSLVRHVARDGIPRGDYPFPIIVTVRLIVFVVACIRAAGEHPNDATPDPPADT